MGKLNLTGKYITVLKGWEGYDTSELIDGKYRPAFAGSISRFFISKTKANEYNKEGKDFMGLKATKENVALMAQFNIKYGADSYRQTGQKILQLLQSSDKSYHEQNLFQDRMRKAKTVRKPSQPTWRGDLKGERI